MCSHTRVDKIKIDHTQQKVQIAHIEHKMRGHLKWFGHILHRPPNALVCMCEIMVSEGVKTGGGRPRIS